MATALAILSALVAVVPFLVEVWRAKRDKRRQATDAIRARDLAELRAGLERVKRLHAHRTPTDKPVL